MNPWRETEVVDLFAGPGGWDVAAWELGLSVVGIEHDPVACKTRRAAGHDTIEGDVRAYGPELFPMARGLIASPPCQTFSMAGKGAGRLAMDAVLGGLRALTSGKPLPEFDDVRTGLVLEPMRWVICAYRSGLPYEWIALEQVPTVLPVWQAYADVLRFLGYSVATGNLQAEQYGVPQTRKRAILVARMNGEARLPEPTHSRYHNRTPDRLDPDVKPWVSMAEALGWGLPGRPSPTITGGGTAAGGAEPIAHLARYTNDPAWVRQRSNYSSGSGEGRQTAEERGRTLRTPEQPSVAITGKPPQWETAMGDVRRSHGTIRRADQPSATLTGALDNGNYQWTTERPATTVQGDPRLPAPGHRCMTSDCHPGQPPESMMTKAVRITVQEAAVLQSFPRDYPWQGTKSQQYQQVGNAIPPLLAQAVLEAAIR